MITKLSKSKPMEVEEGEGARVKRLFPTHKCAVFDPFILFDEFHLGPPAGFPSHSHEGFESLTYVMEGAVRHEDSMGNQCVIKKGGLQRVTAGKGIIHSEMPADAGISHGFQIWINLADRNKGMNPSYQNVRAHEVPEEQWAGGRIRTLCGPRSPIEIQTPILCQDIELNDDHVFKSKIETSYIGLLYVLTGTIGTSDELVRAGEALFWKSDGNLEIRATQTSRFLLLAGLPYDELGIDKK